MLQKLKNLLGIGPKIDMAELIAKGAVIVDVRTPGEFQSGHAKGSINIPLDQLAAISKKVKNREQPIITCCASGMRSASAKMYLKKQGYVSVYNAGPWFTLNKHVK